MSKTKVIWTAFAINGLRQIHQYYKDTANDQVAAKIKNSIINSALILRSHTDAGREEEFLKDLNEGHRYLVEGHYKIIYKMTNDIVYINDVFDSRQNPKKLVKRNR